jgi:hypothetical protein
MLLCEGGFWRSGSARGHPGLSVVPQSGLLEPLVPFQPAQARDKVRQARWRSEWRGLPLHPQTQNVFIFASPIETHGAFVGIVFSTCRLRPDHFSGIFRATSFPFPFPFPPFSLPSPARYSSPLDPPSTTIPCAIAAERQRRHHVRQAHSVRSSAQQRACSNGVLTTP